MVTLSSHVPQRQRSFTPNDSFHKVFLLRYPDQLGLETSHVDTAARCQNRP